MDVLEAIEHAEADLARTRDELAIAKELVASLEADTKKIQVEIIGLRSYAERQGLTDKPAELGDNVRAISADVELAGSSTAPDYGLMSRSDAVLNAMRSLPGPADRNTIHEVLVDGGRFDSIDDISLTLSGLKRSGRAQRLGQGLWQVVNDDPSPTAEVRYTSQ